MHSNSHIKTVIEIDIEYFRQLFQQDPFILSTCDHIFAPELMSRMAKTVFKGDDQGYILVETDDEVILQV
jgi:hypothetical protein